MQMPTVDDDDDAADFDGELDLDVPTPAKVAQASPARSPGLSMSDVDLDDEEPADTQPTPRPAILPGPSARPAAQAQPAATPQPAAAAFDGPDLSDELEEIQFYVDQGLDDDAHAALDDLEELHPGHPQIAEFRRQAFGGASPTPVAAEPSETIEEVEIIDDVEPDPDEDEPEPEPEPVYARPVREAETYRDVDLDEPEPEPAEVRSEATDSMLDLDLDLEPEPEPEAAEPLVSFDEPPAAAEPLVSFEDEDDEDAYLSAIFAEPAKKKPKARTEDSNPGANVAAGQAVDAATAFDLGVAYREMGLVDAAIGQFETAASDPQWRARALTLLGALRVHRGETDRAIADLKEAVRLASTPAEASEAAYELGVLYGVIGDSEAAIQQLLTVAPGYRDRDERLAELGF